MRQVFFHRVIDVHFAFIDRIISAVAVIGFDCEAIQNTESDRIGLLAAMSAEPIVSHRGRARLGPTERVRPRRRDPARGPNRWEFPSTVSTSSTRKGTNWPRLP